MTGSTGTASTFRVGLVQMRAGRVPAANLDAAAKLIGEAKRGGADYVLTPEMTNIMEIGRDKVLAAISAEENDPSLAVFRELARSFGIYLHIGSLAVKVSPEKAANRSLLIDPHGDLARDMEAFCADLPPRHHRRRRLRARRAGAAIRPVRLGIQPDHHAL